MYVYIICFSQIRTDNNSHKRGPKRKTQNVSTKNLNYLHFFNW